MPKSSTLEHTTALIQPLLLGLAATLIIFAIVYKDKTSTIPGVKEVYAWGKEIFKIEMSLACVVIMFSVAISILMGALSALDDNNNE